MPADPRRDFLAAIAADPDADAPRLVFADWLDENGDPDRAEFLRAQVELARLPPGDARRVPLGIREVILRDRHWRRWVEELPKWARTAKVRFRRGMPGYLECTRNEYRRNAAALAKRTAVEGLSFRVSAGSLTDLAGLPQLSRLREFGAGAVDLAETRDFLSAPALTGLRRLTLYLYTGDDPRPGLDLVRLPAVRGLHQLYLLWTRGRDEGPGRDEFFGCEFPALRALTYHSLVGRTAELRALLAAPCLPRLEVLRVLVALTPAHADLLAGAADRTAGLRVLGVSTESEHAQPRLLRACRLPGVRDLRLDHTDDETVRALLDSPLAGQLTRLTLSHHRLTRAGVRELAAPGRLANLARLSLSYGPVDDDMAGDLAAGRGLANLQRLDLDGTRVTAAGLAALARSRHLPALSAVGVAWSRTAEHDPATADLVAGGRLAVFHDPFHED